MRLKFARATVMENGPACCCVFITLRGPGFNNAWLHGTSNIPVFQLGGEEEEEVGGGEGRGGQARRGGAFPRPSTQRPSSSSLSHRVRVIDTLHLSTWRRDPCQSSLFHVNGRRQRDTIKLNKQLAAISRSLFVS